MAPSTDKGIGIRFDRGPGTVGAAAPVERKKMHKKPTSYQKP